MQILGVLAGLELEAQGTDGVKVVVEEPTSVWKQKKCNWSMLSQTLGSFHLVELMKCYRYLAVQLLYSQQQTCMLIYCTFSTSLIKSTISGESFCCTHRLKCTVQFLLCSSQAHGENLPPEFCLYISNI